MAMTNFELHGRFWANMTPKGLAKLDRARALAAGRIYRAPHAFDAKPTPEPVLVPVAKTAVCRIVLYGASRFMAPFPRRHRNRHRKF